MSGVEPKSRTRLRDVANLAGVSVGTASLILNGKGESNRISKDAHQRVQEAAGQLGYVPSLLHRSARRGKTHIFSFYNGLRFRLPGDLFFDRLTSAFELAGGKHRYNVLLHCDFRQSPRETFEFLAGGFCDGVIIYGNPVGDAMLEMLRKTDVPTVQLYPTSLDERISAVGAREEMGLVPLADALYDHGHRRVLGIVPSWQGVEPHRRFETVQERLRERGVDLLDQRIVVEGHEPSALLRTAMSQPEPPTALFVWHDRLAYGMLEACQEMGIQVPRDLSIVGFDGIIWPSVTPHVVTSVEVSLESLAEKAVAVLARLVDGERGPIFESVEARYSPGTTLGPVRSM